MSKQTLTWQVGSMTAIDQTPATMIPAQVPGAVQADYARANNWPPFYQGLNYKMYYGLEDLYWMYTAPLNFTLSDNEIASVKFLGIDYKYQIRVDGEVLFEDEGMFSHVRVDVTRFANAPHELQVILFPAPKEDDSDTRTQARKSCKAAACYSWDWHPYLVSQGLWDEVTLEIQNKKSIQQLDASYVLTEENTLCTLTACAKANEDCTVRFELKDGEAVVAQAEAFGRDAQAVLTLENPKLWNPTGYGDQPMYTLVSSVLGEDGEVLDVQSRRIGFRRVKMVMNEGSWIEPSYFPKSRSDAPATLELNGRRIFAKGSNWVNAKVYPGEMSEEHYKQLLDMVEGANMNILRIWGGGFVNKESFFDMCDEKGIMVWQEFPLSCNEYPDDPDYLAVLEKEVVNIVRRLRTHPCVVLWCGGNELFNNWSLMTDQHHALRLLDSVCYAEDRFTPFIMTSPLNGMAHGHYHNYDKDHDLESMQLFAQSQNTAYTEFGGPSASSPDYIRTFMSEEDFQDCRKENEVWLQHHAFEAWGSESWLRFTEVNHYFGGYDSIDDLCLKTQFIQSMSYRACFEEMRRQWPHCSMSINWCLNEPWPTAANNNLISYPALPKPALAAVGQALRPSMTSLKLEKNLWWAGQTFRGEVWMLNDAIEALPACEITASYQLDGQDEVKCGTFYVPALAAQTHQTAGAISFAIPQNYAGQICIRLRAAGHPEWDSEYLYPCRCEEQKEKKVILNM